MCRENTVTSHLLSWLFSEYERRGIAYCVLRNYQGLPHKTGRDVDILISPKSLVENERVLVEGCRRFGGLFLRRAKGYLYRSYLLFFAGTEAEILLLDFHGSLEEAGIVYFSAQDALRARIRHPGGFYVLEPTIEGVHLLMHSIFGVVPVQTKYSSVILDAFRLNPERFRFFLEGMLGSDLARIACSVMKEGRFEGLITLRGRISRRFLRRPSVCANALIHRAGSRLRRLKGFLRPPGLFVVLVGPDGVGKSTCAAEVKEILGRAVRVVHWHLGFRPVILPARKRIGSEGSRSAVPETQGGSNTERGTRELKGVLGVLRLAYHLLDYLLAYYLRIVPEVARGSIVIGERYIFDYYVDPARKGLHLPLWLTRASIALMPKPSLTILLHDESDAIYARRQELSVSEIQRQIALYRYIGHSLSNFAEVKTRGIRETAIEVTRCIVKRWGQRCIQLR